MIPTWLSDWLSPRPDGRAEPIDPLIEAARTLSAHGAEKRRADRRKRTAEHIAAIQALANGPRPDVAEIEAELAARFPRQEVRWARQAGA
jgi:hypothetical protein